MRYSRTSSGSSGRKYLVSTAVVLVEVIKLGASLAFAVRDIVVSHMNRHGGLPPSPAVVITALQQTLFSPDAWKLVIPAGLYTVQNYLVYIAVSNMDTVSFQVTYQLKILTTVLFSILLLARPVSARQWLALVLLAAGVAIVQTAEALNFQQLTSLAGQAARVLRYPILSVFQQVVGSDAGDGYDVLIQTSPSPSSPSSSSATDSSSVIAVTTTNNSKGLFAALAAATISGLTCVYFEKLIKDSLAHVSLWTRNVQLSFFSLFPAVLLGVMWQDGRAIARHGFFVGYGPAVWAVIALQALGGLLVAVCIAYADNVAKNFAASFSIAVCCVVGAMLGWEVMTVNSAVGTMLVLFAMYMFGSKGSRSYTALLPISREREDDIVLDKL